MTKILPKKKREMLNYLTEYIEERGYAPTLQDIAKHVHEHLSYLEKHGFIHRDGRDIDIQSTEKEKRETLAPSNIFELPIVGLITAGAPIEAIEQQGETLSVPAEMATDDSFILKVKGDSMIESLIADGDYVIIKKQSTALNGDIVVALLEDGSATLKEYHKERDHIRLQPKNKKYEPILVTQVSIQGKVTGVMRSFI